MYDMKFDPNSGRHCGTLYGMFYDMFCDILVMLIHTMMSLLSRLEVYQKSKAGLAINKNLFVVRV